MNTFLGISAVFHDSVDLLLFPTGVKKLAFLQTRLIRMLALRIPWQIDLNFNPFDDHDITLDWARRVRYSRDSSEKRTQVSAPLFIGVQ